MQKRFSSQSDRRSLSDWLSYLESLHPANIEMGLGRSQQVFARLDCDFSRSQVVTIAGTNGKGSTAATLESILHQHDIKTCVYSSPHLIRYTERLRLNGEELEEQAHIRAFEQVEAARGDVPLTYFEFTTLAALYLVAETQPDVAIIEVGLGGRLDVTNVLDNDIAVITTVDIDHVDFLGDNREDIGFEKAGIFRPKGKVVINELDVPKRMLKHAEALQVDAFYRGKDYDVHSIDGEWEFQSQNYHFRQLVNTPFPVENAATAIAVAQQLGVELSQDAVQKAVAKVLVPGRWQRIADKPQVVLDVGHNAQAASYLASQIAQAKHDGINKVYAVVAMLGDKDCTAVVSQLQALVSHWYIAGLKGPRGDDGSRLASCLTQQGLNFTRLPEVVEAYQKALSQAQENDMVVVFGSFHTIGKILEYLD